MSTTTNEKQHEVSTRGRIKVYSGYLVIPGSRLLGTEDVLVRERTMVEYQRFYAAWQVAANELIDAGGNYTFNALWLENERFREHAIAAMQAVGIEQPELLKPAQIDELLFNASLPSDGEGARPYGLVFRLHQDFPTLLKKTGATQEPKPQSPQKPAIWKRFGISLLQCWSSLA